MRVVVDVGVELAQHARLGIRAGAAHDHHRAVALERLRVALQRKPEVRERADREQVELARRLAPEPHELVGGVLAGRRARGGGEADVAEPVRAVDEAGQVERDLQRHLGAAGHRHVAEPARLEHDERVARRVLDRAVAVDAAERDDLGVLARGEQRDRDRVVDPHVHVEHDAPHAVRTLARRASSTSAASVST